MAWFVFVFVFEFEFEFEFEFVDTVFEETLHQLRQMNCRHKSGIQIHNYEPNSNKYIIQILEPCNHVDGGEICLGTNCSRIAGVQNWPKSS